MDAQNLKSITEEFRNTYAGTENHRLEQFAQGLPAAIKAMTATIKNGTSVGNTDWAFDFKNDYDVDAVRKMSGYLKLHEICESLDVKIDFMCVNPLKRIHVLLQEDYARSMDANIHKGNTNLRPVIRQPKKI